MPVPNLQILQYSPPDGTWEDIPGFEGTIVEDYWANIFSPDAVSWWTIGWKTGDVVYYAWEQQNACSGQVLAPGVVGSLPGPPGPPGGDLSSPFIWDQYNGTPQQPAVPGGILIPYNTASPAFVEIPVTPTFTVTKNCQVSMSGIGTVQFSPTAVNDMCTSYFIPTFKYDDGSGGQLQAPYGATPTMYFGDAPNPLTPYGLYQVAVFFDSFLIPETVNGHFVLHCRTVGNPGETTLVHLANFKGMITSAPNPLVVAPV